MKIFLLLTVCFLITQTAQAAFMMKAGKWKIETLISRNGGPAIDPSTQLKEALKKMTPEQKKQMEEIMDKKPHSPKIGFEDSGLSVCYTQEMFDTDLGMKKLQVAEKCSVFDQQRTTTLTSMKFKYKYKCENGSSGETEWKAEDETHMSGVTKTLNAKGETAEVRYKAEFLDEECD